MILPKTNVLGSVSCDESDPEVVKDLFKGEGAKKNLVWDLEREHERLY